MAHSVSIDFDKWLVPSPLTNYQPIETLSLLRLGVHVIQRVQCTEIHCQGCLGAEIIYFNATGRHRLLH